MAKRKRDNIDRDVATALRLGYGVHYGHYKADHPHTRGVQKELEPEVEAEKEVVCRHCGKVFLQQHGSQRFCSDACRRESIRIRNREYKRKKSGIYDPVNCAVCGKSFLRTTCHQIYCSPRCLQNANYENMKRRREADKHAQALGEQLRV